jgi:phage terminase small subunit
MHASVEKTTRILTGRREKFCRFIVQGQPQQQAYENAGYSCFKGVSVAASRLLKSVSVQKRIGELQREAARRAAVTAELILRELEEARLAAMESGQYGAAVAASLGRARVAGLLVDQKQVDIVYHKPVKEVLSPLLEMDETQWIETYAPRLDQ